jgi:hypothetical protein
MRNLISYEEISQLARPCTTDREMAEAMIAEAQRVEIKPRLGDALYLKILADEPEERLGVLLNGGIWKDNCGEHLLTGVKTALAYYALARIIRDGNIQATRYGAVVKDDQYSQDAEKTERQRQYRELFAQADGYMAEAVQYLAENCETFPEYQVKGKMRSNRTTIKIIGR